MQDLFSVSDVPGGQGMVASQFTTWHLILGGLGLVAYLWGKTRSVTRDTGMPEDEVERSEQLQQGSGQMGARHAGYRRGLGIGAGVKPDAFIRALREGRWHDVMTERDFERIAETFETAVERKAAGFIIGFALRGRPTRVVWADVLVVPAGIVPPEQLPPGVPPGTRAFDTRLSGFAFVENPDADASELRPSRFAERPWFLTEYPGRVSWTELRQAVERPG
jgi:hypothetical protein